MKEQSFWWEEMHAPGAASEPVSGRVDLAIVGGGLTGLAAARIAAQSGLRTLVLDAGNIGRGASSGNTGYVGRSFGHSLTSMIKKKGRSLALETFGELSRIYDAAAARTQELGIQCDWQATRRFMPAFTSGMLDKLKREYLLRAELIGEAVKIIDHPEDLPVKSHRFVGGIVIDRQVAIHPGKYVQGLASAAKRAGADLRSGIRVERYERRATGFRLTTAHGQVNCSHLLMATNGYSGPAFAWLRRRIVPVPGYHIVTEPLDASTVQSIFSEPMLSNDTREFPNGMRLTPDGRRIIFFGLTGSNREHRLALAASELKSQLVGFCPRLAKVRVDYVWTCRCAATFDLFPRTGVRDGVHFVAGMRFAGNAMAPYLGERAVRRILGEDIAPSVFEKNDLWAPPGYYGRAWFLPAMNRIYGWLEQPKSWSERSGSKRRTR